MNLDLSELKLWAIYTYFDGGTSNICVCKDIDAVLAIVRQTRKESKIKLIGESIRRIGIKLEQLDDGDQLYIEFNDSTSMVIQKISKIVGS